MRVLVLNTGSSTLKYDLVAVDADAAGGPAEPLPRIEAGVIERVTDHRAAA